MKRRSVLMLTSLVPLLLVQGCASVGGDSNCGPNDKAIYHTDEEIDHMSDETAKAVLTHNETMYQRGCSSPN